MSKPAIAVVAGIIFDQSLSKVLLAYRHAGQHQGNRWEFPGGKIETDEPARDALFREIQEELGIQVLNCKHRSTTEYQYPEKSVCLQFWDVLTFSGNPEGREGQQIQWFAIQDLARLQFPEANQAIVDSLLAEHNQT